MFGRGRAAYTDLFCRLQILGTMGFIGESGANCFSTSSRTTSKKQAKLTSWWLNQPIWKNQSNWIISPGFGVKNKKYIWNHPPSSIPRLFLVVVSFCQEWDSQSGWVINGSNWMVILVIIPETNVAPENGWLEYSFPFGMAHFQVRTVSFREGIIQSKSKVPHKLVGGLKFQPLRKLKGLLWVADFASLGTD